jgi:hypothetical protein
MAKLMLIGRRADVKLIAPGTEGEPEARDELYVAVCMKHCEWTETYDTLDDAAEYAADHADRG